MSKYIIKNCPAFVKSTKQCRGAFDNNIKHQYCSGNSETDCPIKQIVKKCKRTGFTALMGGDELLKIGILNLLEIERVK